MARVNLCDTECPLTVLREAEYDIFSADKSPISRVGLAAKVGASILGHMGKAAFFCPMSNRPANDWRPDAGCENAVRDFLDKEDVDHTELAARMTERQFNIIGPYLDLPGPEDEPTAL